MPTPLTPEEVLADLFESDEFNPFSDPEAAAKQAMQRLRDAGFLEVEERCKS